MERPLFIRHAAELVTLAGTSNAPVRGRRMGELNVIEGGSVWIEGDTIRDVGHDEEVACRQAAKLAMAEEIDARGKLVTPGLVDAHTHVVYAGERAAEFERRLRGASYMEILKSGGGILNTMRATRAATEEALVAETLPRLDRFLIYGVTTIEAKSGYGLSISDELKQLRAIRRLQALHPVELVPTFMGAHAVPPEDQDDPERYVRRVIEEMIPAVAAAGLAEFVDVFCERGVFTLEQSERILRAGQAYGFKAKVHADEIEPYGGTALAAGLGAVSADHLLQARDEDLAALASAGTVAVLLPGTAFFLMTPAANGRKMIDMGLAVALATDSNPGSSPTESMPLMMNLACLTMGMTPAEALTAATINAAHAIGRGRLIGSLEVGKQADLVIFDVPDHVALQYHYGVNHVHTVIKRGRVVVKGGVRA